MSIVGGFDVHRNQITFDCLDTETGEITRGEIRPATRARLREWLRRFEGREVAIALEATTGWRFVVEELKAAGIEAHLAEPADTRALRGPKRRAKNDRQDARHLRQLLETGRLPESWIPPEHIQELRTVVRLRKTLTDDRRAWQQRIQAVLTTMASRPVPTCSRATGASGWEPWNSARPAGKRLTWLSA